MERKVSRVESFRTSLKNQKQRLMAQKQVCMMYYYFNIEIFKIFVNKINNSFSWQLQNSFGKLGIGGKLKEKEKKEEPKVRDIYCL
jgi:hypothetical protein